MEFRNFARALPLLTAALILILPLGVQAAKPSGGGSGKVSVTAANPADAFQGEELDVIVSGSGFDQGSQVSYLVTGTTDGSQVEVLSVEFISASELKTRVRPKDAALPSEYDIQVQTSSGRKGKGTTLFRVKSRDEDLFEPALAVGITGKGKGRGQPYGSLYVFEADGDRNQIIVGRAADLFYNSLPLVWTPDGSTIIWVDGEANTINSVNVDGSDQRVLLPYDGTLMPHYGGVRNIGTSRIDCVGSAANLLYFQAVIEGDPLWRTNFYLMDLNDPQSQPVQLTDTPDLNYYGLTVAPDGLRVATWTNDEPNDAPRSATSRLEIRDLCAPGLPVLESWTAADLGLPPFSSIDETSWSVDHLLAATVYYPRDTSSGQPSDWTQEIFLIDLSLSPETVQATKVIGGGTGVSEGVDSTRARWSPDGSTLLFVSDFHSMYALDIATGAVRFLFNSGTVIRDIDWRPTWGAVP